MPAEQVGKHIDGTFTKLTRAALGSDGTLGGSGGGATTIEGCAQAVTSSASSVSISARGSDLFSSITGLLVKCGLPRLFDGAEFGRGLGRLFADVGKHGGVVRVHRPLGSLHARQVPPAGQGKQRRDHTEGDVGADRGQYLNSREASPFRGRR